MVGGNQVLKESNRHDLVPLSPNAMTALMQVPAVPAKGTQEQQELEAGVGF
jgi:hypothetical protein